MKLSDEPKPRQRGCKTTYSGFGVKRVDILFGDR